MHNIFYTHNYCNKKFFIPSNKNIYVWLYTALKLTNNSNYNIEINIIYVENYAIKKINYKYRNVNKVTNVLSFPILYKNKINFLGDIIICSEKIELESIQYKKNLLKHWCHIIIHGFLHLIGYDHIQKYDSIEMESLEYTIISEIGFI